MPLHARLAGTLAALVAVAAVAADAQTAPTLNICHAGSLLAAFTQVEKAFGARHPDAKINDVSGGSVELARHLATGTQPCDIYASADALNIELMLEPAKLADYTIELASGRMVLAYLATDPKVKGLPVSGTFTPPSSVPELGAKWYDTLLEAGVRISGAHPFLDPGGYRSHLIFELAQAYYQVPSLYNDLLGHVTLLPADAAAPAPALGKDFSFQITYEHSAAAAAKNNPAYRYARFPDRIDLSNPANEARYAAASITLPGLGIAASRPWVTLPGSRATWGVTVIKTSPHQALATSFLELMLGDIGTGALRGAGPAPFAPAQVSRDDFARLPKSIQPLVTITPASARPSNSK